MGVKFYAVIDSDGGVVGVHLDEGLRSAAVFMEESDAYEFLIRSGDKNCRVIEVGIISKKEPEND